MTSFLKLAAIAGGYVVAYTFWTGAYARRMRRRELFVLAVARTKTTGKPLVVVGDPDSGTASMKYGRDYGCGALCVDINGCPKCENQVKAPIQDWLRAQKDNSAVLFVSCVLEYVDADVRPIIKDLYRVSGGDLFVVTVEPWTTTAFTYRGAQRRFFSAPPSGPFRWSELRR
jgi:hypothetical protein